MIRAHQFIEAAIANSVGAGPDVMRWDHTRQQTYLLGLIKGIYLAKKFSFQMNDSFDDLAISATATQLWNAGAMRLPFDVCWFEFSYASEGLTLCVLAQTRGATTRAYPVWWDNGTWSVWGTFYEYDAPGWRFSQEGSPREEEIHVLLCGLCLMSTAAYDATIVPAPQKLNAARQKKGKPPLYEHTVVTLKPWATKGRSDHSRAHASPRLHWRRGHVRRLTSGAFTSVGPCLVGLADRGFVSKDYAVLMPPDGAHGV